MLMKRQCAYLGNLAAFLVALFLGTLLYYNMVDVERLQTEQGQLKQDVLQLHRLVEERTHPEVIQKRQIEYLLQQGEFKE